MMEKRREKSICIVFNELALTPQEGYKNNGNYVYTHTHLHPYLNIHNREDFRKIEKVKTKQRDTHAPPPPSPSIAPLEVQSGV